MKGIILAAGRGSRMAAMTNMQPKCFTELAGQSLFDWQVEALKEAGVSDLVIVRGYKRECFDRYSYTMVDNPQWAETNMLMSLCCAADHLREDEAIISYADIVYHPDSVRSLIAAQENIVIAYDRLWHSLWRDRFENPLEDAEIFQVEDTGLLKEIGGKTNYLDKIKGQYLGLLKFTKKGWLIIEEILANEPDEVKDRMDMTALLRLLLEKGIEIMTVPVDGRWCEVDNQHDLNLYKKRINEVDSATQSWVHDWRWKRK